MKQKNKDLKKYINEIKRSFPYIKKNEKKFLKNFRDNLLLSIDDCCDYEYLVQNFGHPSDIAAEYFEGKKVTSFKKRFIINFLSILFIAVLILFILTLLKEIHNSQKSYIDREIIELKQ